MEKSDETHPRRTESASSGSDATILRGRVIRITFRNAENGYTIFQIKSPDADAPVTITGYVGRIELEYEVIARGAYTRHPKFGRQFAARAITATVPATEAGFERYLSSGTVKGIGPDLAKRIVEHLGDRAVEVINHDPSALTNIPGIGKSKARALVAALTGQSTFQKILQFLVEHGVSPSFAEKIYKRYGEATIDVLQRNPYRLARDIRGIGFRTADTIATAGLGLPLNSPDRLRAGLSYALEKGGEEGHCFLTEQEVIERTRLLLQVSDDTDIGSLLRDAEREGDIHREPHGLYLLPLWEAEQSIVSFVNKRRDSGDAPSIDPLSIEQTIVSVQRDLGIAFSEEQAEAVRAAASHRLLVITGGPGCGKTTIIRALTALFQQSGRRLLMAAPTGRAAQRMSQVCDVPATTIHRLLRYNPGTGDFSHNEGEPLLADAVIIDESSMLDVNLAASLFSAIPRRCTLVLVGDKDQLPSVGPGKVFGDIIDSGAAKVIRLNRLYRRSEESTINTIALGINGGLVPEIPSIDDPMKVDAYFISRRDPSEAMEVVAQLVAHRLPHDYSFDPSDIMVLTPSNKGPLGTIAVNARLQDAINPARAGRPELQFGSVTFRVGDRVCQRANNYQIDPIGVFNGDLGIITEVRPDTKSLVVMLWDGRNVVYKPADLGQLGLAYALTVHRSQGSEIPCVVLLLHDSHYMLLERQLIYTAVTRAKQFLIIVGSRRALHLAVSRVSSRRRNTAVVQLLTGTQESRGGGPE